ncbi:MAG: glycosyltransferase family 2 protein [Dissulfurispiraceae bacterium]|jgi:glycosyltransferase involved in cell wall biosynthesis
MIPVSVIIAVKNEERNIEDALKSVSGFREIIIIDDFSADRTVSIAQKYTGNIFQIKWQGFARQKQSGIDKASLPWVLVLDADERVTAPLADEIRAAVGSAEYNSYYIPRKNFFLGRWIRHGGWWPDYTLRLFRKNSAHMELREVHEKIIARGKAGHCKNPMEHYTYREISDYIKKMDAYSMLAARELHQKGVPFRFYQLILKPPATFLRMLFLQQGFRDGIHGFILASLYSFYTFLKYLKLWEISKLP